MFDLPLGIEQGAFVAESPAPYTFALTLAPTFNAERFRVAIPFSAVFDNPDWSLALGVSPSLKVCDLLTEDSGLRVLGYARTFVVGGQQGGYQAGGGLSVDFIGLSLAQTVGYDGNRRSAVITTTLSIRPFWLLALLVLPFASGDVD